jgi:Ca2+-binding EF-hand superfamily protein
MYWMRIVAVSMVVMSLDGVAAPGPEQDQAKQAPSFRELDEDGDGRVTKSEAVRAPELVTRFDNWDSDKDGQLTRAEYRIGLLGHPSR